MQRYSSDINEGFKRHEHSLENTSLLLLFLFLFLLLMLLLALGS